MEIKVILDSKDFAFSLVIIFTYFTPEVNLDHVLSTFQQTLFVISVQHANEQ